MGKGEFVLISFVIIGRVSLGRAATRPWRTLRMLV